MHGSFDPNFSEDPNPPITFGDLGRLFLELKGKGACLSSLDIEILLKWQKQGFDPDEISRFLIETYNFNHSQQKPFPSSLSSIDRDLSSFKSKWG